MNFPNELKYTKHDEWVKMIDDTTALVGITDFAQDQLSDIVFVTLPEVGDEAVADEKYGDVESTKAVSDLVSPVSGTICEVNTELDDSPELLNEDPYANWIMKVENVTALADGLMDAAAYEADTQNR
ncbi:MAG: glycine cleavage system protein GcvH [Oscillospiraceae bacterium]|nr:glycine cleavage system protein GcvH [Oscillospiraceae bacterium]